MRILYSAATVLSIIIYSKSDYPFEEHFTSHEVFFDDMYIVFFLRFYKIEKDNTILRRRLNEQEVVTYFVYEPIMPVGCL